MHLGYTPTHAELHAIGKAAEWLIEQNIAGKKIFYCSDSKSALQRLSKGWINGKQESEIVQNLNKLAENNEVKLRWIKAHVGLRGNEIADRLAKRGAENTNNEMIIEPALPVSIKIHNEDIDWVEKEK